MSIADFETLSPEEFAAVYRAFERTHVREPWERARFVSCSSLQPWSKKSLQVTDVCRFAWDDENRNIPKAPPAPPSTRERFNEIVRRIESKV